MHVITGGWSWSFHMAFVLFLVITFQCWCRFSTCTKDETEVKIPALFAFGDSIVDPGNNNDRPTLAKSNFPPYGKDFEGGKATGRFSNGRLPTDFIAELLGIKKNLPPYLDRKLQEQDLLTGVSFASAASGYDSLTSATFSSKSTDDQLEMFEEYSERITAFVGEDRRNFIINNSIYAISFGSCDLANTYFLFPFRRLFYDVDSYTDMMLEAATSFLQKLHKVGARKIVVSNVPPLGYLPMQRTIGGGSRRSIVEKYNEAVQIFNTKLKAKLENLNAKLYQSQLVCIDIYSIFLGILLNKTHYGFEVVDKGCCGSGLIEVAVLCNPFSIVCSKKYMFWDSYHPTEKAYETMAQQIVKKYLTQFR